MEVGLPQIFDRPLGGREFFEEIIRDNLDLGRPDRVQLIFGRRVTKKTPGEFRTWDDLRRPVCAKWMRAFDLADCGGPGREKT
jgi:hypothetical protein